MNWLKAPSALDTRRYRQRGAVPQVLALPLSHRSSKLDVEVGSSALLDRISLHIADGEDPPASQYLQRQNLSADVLEPGQTGGGFEQLVRGVKPSWDRRLALEPDEPFEKHGGSKPCQRHLSLGVDDR